jgi:hypothetical protein
LRFTGGGATSKVLLGSLRDRDNEVSLRLRIGNAVVVMTFRKARLQFAVFPGDIWMLYEIVAE